MDLLDFLRPEHVVVPLEATGIRDAILKLLDRLEATGTIEPSEGLRRRVANEPVRDVVAISEDVVLPHYRSGAAPDIQLALGIAADRIPGHDAGLDVRPRIVALVLAPQDAASLYLQATSTLARLLRQPGIVDRIAAVRSGEELLALPELQGLRIQPRLTVRDLMIHRVHVVPPETSVREVLDLLLRRRLHAVPVVGDKGEVLGIVTEADLMRALLPHMPRAGEEEGETEEEPAQRPVRDIMTRSVLCVSEDLGVSEVASMMINKNVEQVPVVQAGAITGMVTRTDILRKLFGRS